MKYLPALPFKCYEVKKVEEGDEVFYVFFCVCGYMASFYCQFNPHLLALPFSLNYWVDNNILNDVHILLE